MPTEPDFSVRTRALLGDLPFEKLSRPLVAISGLGGVGGAAFMTLLRAGVRRFRLAENGIFDPPDMNRQWGAIGTSMGRPKIEVYEECALGINPEVEIQTFPEGIHLENIETFLAGADVYLGAIDIDKGREIKVAGERIVRREGIPLFTGGAIGMGAIMINYHPEGMTPAEFWAQVARRSDGPSLFPSFLCGFFEKTLMDNILKSFSTGTSATCASGGGQAGLLVGTEILIHLLQGSGLVDRSTIFAPRFVALDLARMEMNIVDVTA